MFGVFYSQTGKCFLKCLRLRKVVFSITPLGFLGTCVTKEAIFKHSPLAMTTSAASVASC